MKKTVYQNVICVLMGCLCSMTVFADASAALGVQLSDEPLSALLTKHLQLEQGRGVLIQNVQVDSAADKAGLDKDDIIISLNDEPLMSPEALITAVKDSQVGSDVGLTVIQSGVRRDIEIRLEARQVDGSWKYPPALESSHIWRPGRIFQFGPGLQGRWVLPDQIQQPGNSTGFPYGFVNAPRLYHYQHRSGDEAFSVMIKGDPEQEDTAVTVTKNGQVYTTTIGQIDTLPDEFKEAVRDDIEKAKNQTVISIGKGNLPEVVIPEFNSGNFPGVEVFKNRPFPDSDLQEKLDRMQEQMDQLQQKLDRLEKQRLKLDELESRTDDHDEIRT